LKLRDRDAIITEEGLIFRVFGYTHPESAYVCDAEYAPAAIFKSANPKAFRSKGRHVFCKFYEGEGWSFVQRSFPQHMIFHEMLQKKVVGVDHHHVVEVRKPDEVLRRLVATEPEDELLAAMQKVLKITTQHSSISIEDFGVFGSMFHGFHNSKFSDIDLIVCGRKNASCLRETLDGLYESESSCLRNEFETEESLEGKHWRFRNISPREFVWHQRRKMIYALFKDDHSGRVIKTEFEPVKDWDEIRNEYNSETRVLQKGWVKMLARVSEDSDVPFVPSIYGIEPAEIFDGAVAASEATRIVSYMEEFRLQAYKDELVYVEGNLEEVKDSKGSFHQITLTYCPRYFEQVLKVNV
jgi:hypothetical protein